MNPFAGQDYFKYADDELDGGNKGQGGGGGMLGGFSLGPKTSANYCVQRSPIFNKSVFDQNAFSSCLLAVTVKVLDEDQANPVKVYIKFKAGQGKDYNIRLPETELKFIAPANDRRERMAFVFEKINPTAPSFINGKGTTDIDYEVRVKRGKPGTQPSVDPQLESKLEENEQQRQMFAGEFNRGMGGGIFMIMMPGQRNRGVQRQRQ